MDRHFTLDEARALVPEVRARTAELQPLRADLAELGAALQRGGTSPLGGLPELKGVEARIHELLAWFGDQGIQVKGVSPLLIDFPAVAAGREVLLCWLEGDDDLAWWHEPAHGFAGRRPLAELDWA